MPPGPQPTAFIEENLTANASLTLRAVGPWLLLYGGASLMTGLELRALETNYGGQVGWRTATTDTDVPNVWQTLLTQRTTNDIFPESVDVSAQTDIMWIQGSLWSSLTTGSTPKSALNRLWYSVKGAGWIVGRQRIHLPASSTTDIIPIGAPFNCVGVTGLMYAIIYTNLTATIAPTGVARMFKTGNPRRPEAWGDVVSMTSQTSSGDSARDTKSGSLTTTDRVMAQAGLKYSTSGGGNPGGLAEVIVVAKTT
jgi:hypothetical protein